MYRVEIITEECQSVLQRRVNAFIADKEVVSVSFEMVKGECGLIGYYGCCILYKVSGEK